MKVCWSMDKLAGDQNCKFPGKIPIKVKHVQPIQYMYITKKLVNVLCWHVLVNTFGNAFFVNTFCLNLLFILSPQLQPGLLANGKTDSDYDIIRQLIAANLLLHMLHRVMFTHVLNKFENIIILSAFNKSTFT